jgi:transposase-like protein
VTAHRATSVFAGFRFPREVISVAVRWYLRYGLSYRDAGELLAERGVTVDHVSIYRWVQRFTTEFIEAAKPCRHIPGDRWFVDETYVKVAGTWTYLYRAIDQHGQVIDVLLSNRRGLEHRSSSRQAACWQLLSVGWRAMTWRLWTTATRRRSNRFLRVPR